MTNKYKTWSFYSKAQSLVQSLQERALIYGYRWELPITLSGDPELVHSGINRIIFDPNRKTMSFCDNNTTTESEEISVFCDAEYNLANPPAFTRVNEKPSTQTEQIAEPPKYSYVFVLHCPLGVFTMAKGVPDKMTVEQLMGALRQITAAFKREVVGFLLAESVENNSKIIGSITLNAEQLRKSHVQGFFKEA
jgi:hypothetical protein